MLSWKSIRVSWRVISSIDRTCLINKKVRSKRQNMSGASIKSDSKNCKTSTIIRPRNSKKTKGLKRYKKENKTQEV